MAGYLKAVWPEFVGSVFGVWAAPGGFKTIEKCRGRRSHIFLAQKNDPNKSGHTAFRYPV